MKKKILTLLQFVLAGGLIAFFVYQMDKKGQIGIFAEAIKSAAANTQLTLIKTSNDLCLNQGFLILNISKTSSDRLTSINTAKKGWRMFNTMRVNIGNSLT